MSRDANLPSLADDSFVVLGDAMGSVVNCVIEARLQFVEGLRCNFWLEVIETEFPEFLDIHTIRVVRLEPSTVRLAAEYGSAALKLQPTRLPDYED